MLSYRIGSLAALAVTLLPLVAQAQSGPAVPSPMVQPDPPVTALGGTLRAREVRDLRDGRETLNIRYPVVDRGDAAATADLTARIQAEVFRTGMGSFGYSRGRCRATLATEALVSVLCEYTTAGERGSPPHAEAAAFTFRLRAGSARRVSMAEVFVDGARIHDAVCAKAMGRVRRAGDPFCFGVAVAFGPRGVVARWAPDRGRARNVEVPYAELAPYIRADGPLAFASGPAPAVPTPATEAATPQPATTPLTCAYFGGPMTAEALGRAAANVDLVRVYIKLDPLPDGRFRFAARVNSPLSPAEQARYVSAFGPRTDGPCPFLPVHLSRSMTTGEATLRATPGGAVVGTVPSGATVVQFDGVVLGHESHRAAKPPGLTRFVVGPDAAGFSAEPVFRGY